MKEGEKIYTGKCIVELEEDGVGVHNPENLILGDVITEIARATYEALTADPGPNTTPRKIVLCIALHTVLGELLEDVVKKKEEPSSKPFNMTMKTERLH